MNISIPYYQPEICKKKILLIYHNVALYVSHEKARTWQAMGKALTLNNQ